MTLHKEGYTIIAGATLLLLILNAAIQHFMPTIEWLHLLFLAISVIFLILIIQFFRVPKRVVTTDETRIVAPCDGKVVVIEEVVESEYFKGPRRQISIFMSPLNVHVNWNPISGIVQYFKYHPGLYLVAWHPKSSTDNERTTTVIRTAQGQEILFRQIAGAVARRIRWYIKEGDAVQQSTQMGFIKFGSRVDIFVPLDAKINVNLNDKTVGSVTVLAELPA
ncbi:phosphatidylserine decarboxylase family protein [Arundinibacter roseus]|uniref:Phosphatidylserine decarboxylase proenzyme n=1 Tax=Arundinibacter roseus TaxID=2070510 RepID=A0A4R4K311_9BACT|nr:phosphatidylserine decarboxylase family protein [Arundinibacter roseus]TDB60439.1 phosphatidylserine decarboxylase family protein [Arundinibacter roseus]